MFCPWADLAEKLGPDSEMAGGSFIFVHVPCDEAASCTEWTLEYTEDTLVSCLTDHLKKHFARQARAAVAGGDLRTCAVRFAI